MRAIGSTPAPVTVATVEKADVPYELRAPGAVEAIQTVGVKPQVGGTLIAVGFQEGQDVRKGQVLFRIDPRPFEAALAQVVGMRVFYMDGFQARLARLFRGTRAAAEA
jgi:multidrug efflux pump subunit AcrA (membrane-fusion protein)